MKIKLNELRQLVKRIIKEENEETPDKIFNKGFKYFQEKYNEFKSGKENFRQFLLNLPGKEKNFSDEISSSINSAFGSFNQMREVYSNMFNEFKSAGNISNVVKIIKTRVPEFFKYASEANKHLEEASDASYRNKGTYHEALIDNILQMQKYLMGGLANGVRYTMNSIPAFEAILPPSEINVPEKQTNVPQQQTNVPQQGSSQLRRKISELKNNVTGLWDSFENLKYQYGDGTSATRISNLAYNLLMPIENTISSILNSNLSENYSYRTKRSKRFIFEGNSIKESIFANYFEDDIIFLIETANNLDESMGIEAIKSKLSDMEDRIKIIKDNLSQLE